MAEARAVAARFPYWIKSADKPTTYGIIRAMAEPSLPGKILAEKATAEVLRVIASSRGDLQLIFDTIVRSALRLCEAGHVSLHRVEGDVMRQVARHGPSVLERGETRPIKSGYLAGRAILTRKIVHVTDALAIAAKEFPDGFAAIKREGVRTALAVPLLVLTTASALILVAVV